MKNFSWIAICGVLSCTDGRAQSADWQGAVWREPQVRYLLCDMTLVGNIEMYREPILCAGHCPADVSV